MANPAALGPLFQKERDQLEERWTADPPDSRSAFFEADVLLANWTQAISADPVPDIRPWWVRRHWQKRNRWAGLTM
jgi:hypothetical protein